MPRLLFEKTGNAVWISHLDLMRLFQRGFKRAGLHLTHTQGFNPRPSVSIALPLSVGIGSNCELLDFDLDGEVVSCELIKDQLNRALIPGVRVVEVYENARKIKDLALLDCILTLQYDNGVPCDCVEQINELFEREMLIVQRKTKNGIRDQDIVPMIRSVRVQKTDEDTVTIYATICCQNPSLNPMQLSAAICTYLPDLQPDFVKCTRLEVYDNQGNIFR